MNRESPAVGRTRWRAIAHLGGVILAYAGSAAAVAVALDVTIGQTARLAPRASCSADPRIASSARPAYANEPFHITVVAAPRGGVRSRCRMLATLVANRELIVAIPQQHLDPATSAAGWLVTPSNAGTYLATVELRDESCAACGVVAASTTSIVVDEDRAYTRARTNLESIAASISNPVAALHGAIHAQRDTVTDLTFEVKEPVRDPDLRDVRVVLDSVRIPGSGPPDSRRLGSTPGPQTFRVVVTPPHHQDLAHVAELTVIGSWHGRTISADPVSRVVQVEVQEESIGRFVSDHLEWLAGIAGAAIVWLWRWFRRRRGQAPPPTDEE